MTGRRGFAPGDARASAAGIKGGAIRGQQLQEQRELMWRERYPDVPVAISRAIYQDGYNAGHSRGVKVGKRAGAREGSIRS